MKTVSFTLSVIGLAVATSAFATEKPVLNVYTYDSFASKYGPASQLEANFEKVCHCDLRFLPFDNGVTMLNRIRLMLWLALIILLKLKQKKAGCLLQMN